MVSLLTFLLQAIYELFRGEQDLIEDLQLARKVRKLKCKQLFFKKQKIYFPFCLLSLPSGVP